MTAFSTEPSPRHTRARATGQSSARFLSLVVPVAADKQRPVENEVRVIHQRDESEALQEGQGVEHSRRDDECKALQAGQGVEHSRRPILGARANTPALAVHSEARVTQHAI